VADTSTPATPAEPAPRSPQHKWTDELTPKRIIAGLIVIAALLFIFQNTQTGDFHFLFFDFKAPKWLWLSAIFAAGFLAGWLFSRHRASKSASTSK
jgi:uncharacterized integral membrane protein